MILNSVRTIALAVVASTLALSSLSKAADFKVNGFGSAYYGQALNRELLPYNLSNTNPDFTHFSLIGADLAVKFNDQWTVAAELIAQGQNGPQNNYTAYAEWAYVNWAPIPGMSVKVGRQRNPIWSASEYINSHYQLPYRVMPQVVYSLSPFAAFDGASVTQTL
ncbi:MAG: hypothetical protein H7301_03180, partial [Cryobacterium sp.]|nr:hypothetical protein [Oligoflexia bacterium]